MGNQAATEFEKRILLAIASLEEGEVVSYGDIAAKAGNGKAPRAVGRFLSSTSYKVPWWRVVRSNGTLAPCNLAEQKQRLEAEDVCFKGNRIHRSPSGRFSESGQG